MHTGKSYKLSEFLIWTRRDIYVLIVLGVVPVVAYQIGSIKWLSIPSTVVALLGTATAFVVGFKNLQTYSRTWEARQIWGDIISSSRAWATMSRDFLDNAEKSTELVYRHLAWLTALRYQLRENRVWETISKAYNAEYLKYYSIPETQTALETELAKYLPDAERKEISCHGQQGNPDHEPSKQNAKRAFRRPGDRPSAVPRHAKVNQGFPLATRQM